MHMCVCIYVFMRACVSVHVVVHMCMCTYLWEVLIACYQLHVHVHNNVHVCSD